MTEQYREHLIVGDKTFGYKEVKPVGKGSVHLSLRGKYTTAVQARQAIDSYLDTIKVVKGDKAD